MYVWGFDSRSLGPHELRQPGWPVNNMSTDQDPRHYARSVAISVCGNFCVVGTNSGAIYKYNMQSGQPRGSFPKTAARKKRALPGTKTAGSLKVTAKKLKKSFSGSGSLRNAAGKLLKHVKRDDVPPGDSAAGEGEEGEDGEAMDEEAAAAMAAAAVAEAAAAAKALAGHAQTVTGVQIDALNRHLISASLDGKLSFVLKFILKYI